MDRANELIKQMLYAGMSRSEIANKLGVTRNSIVGRVYRMKKTGQLPNFEDNEPGRPTNKQRMERKKSDKRRKRPAPSKRFNIEAPADWTPTPVAVKSSDHKVGLYLLELERLSDCRFPVGRHQDQHTFCGNPGHSPKRPYCEAHKPMVWIKPTGQRPKQKFKQTGFNSFVYGND